MGSTRACSVKLGDSVQLSYRAVHLLLLRVADEHPGSGGHEDYDTPAQGQMDALDGFDARIGHICCVETGAGCEEAEVYARQGS